MTMTGCGKRRDKGRPIAFVEHESQYVAVIVVDLSGSFSSKMAQHGKAYEFALHVMETYFRRRDALHDRIIIAQISGTDRPLLWEGTPLQLRSDFPSAESFRDFLLKHADGSGSLVSESVATVVEYVNSRIEQGGTKSAVLILSDMEDTATNSGTEARVDTAFAEYGRHNGAVGIYFCDQHEVANWKARLKDAGVQNVVVESGIVGAPALPTFD